MVLERRQERGIPSPEPQRGLRLDVRELQRHPRLVHQAVSQKSNQPAVKRYHRGTETGEDREGAGVPQRKEEAVQDGHVSGTTGRVLEEREGTSEEVPDKEEGVLG